MSIRAVAVDYHNTLPLRVGIQRLVEGGQLSLKLEHPAEATRQFMQGDFEIGLLPAAANLFLPTGKFVGNHGIVSDGFVGSVGIFSEVPLKEAATVFLDHDSRSSVLLARILLKHFWKLSPKLVEAKLGYRSKILGRTAGVIIGDPAIEARSNFEYYYDLGEAWLQMTGLPFVFAAWQSTRSISNAFVEQFDKAQQEGIDRRVEIAKEFQHLVPSYDLVEYFTEQIKFTLDARARRGLQEFLRLGREELKSTESHNGQYRRLQPV